LSAASGPARRYAKALYQSAVQDKALPAVLQSVHLLQGAVDESLAAALSDPRLSRKQRATVAVNLAQAVNAPAVLKGALLALAANNRLGLLPDVLKATEELDDHAANRLRARVESAQPLTAAQRTTLEDILRKNTKANAVELEEITRPTLLGGLRVFFGGKVWDASVQGSFQSLAEHVRSSLNRLEA